MLPSGLPRLLSLMSVGFPLITATILSTALTETVCRQWIWYRLLQQGVIMDFKSSHQSIVVKMLTNWGAH